MPKLPILKPEEIVKILEKIGFKEIRQKGSHKQFKNKNGKQTTVPFHKGKDISPILLDKIINPYYAREFYCNSYLAEYLRVISFSILT